MNTDAVMFQRLLLAHQLCKQQQQQHSADTSALNSMPNPLQQYAASIMAQINLGVYQPTAVPTVSPFPNLDQLRQALMSPLKQSTSSLDIHRCGGQLYPKSAPNTPQKLMGTNTTPQQQQQQHRSYHLQSPSQARKRCTQHNATMLSSKSEQKLPASTRALQLLANTSPQSRKDTNAPGGSPTKRARSVRKQLALNDQVTNSPVSGMFIREASEVPPPEQLQMEMDETAKFVEITDETKAALASIPNIIGDYVCCLCKVKFCDAFRLAQHRCPRIVHEEYKCPECDKVFSCPANLASHRRWHKPKQPANLVGNKSNRSSLIGSSSDHSNSDSQSTTSSSPLSDNESDQQQQQQQQQPLNLATTTTTTTADVSLDNDTNTSFMCPICDCECDTAVQLRQHALTHTPFGVGGAQKIHLPPTMVRLTSLITPNKCEPLISTSPKPASICSLPVFQT